MKIDREILLKALDTCKPAIAAKEMITQSTCFAFTGEHIVSYDDQLAIQVPFKTEFVGAVSANELHGLVSRAKGEFVEFEIEDEVLTVKSGRARAGIPFQDAVLLPLEEIVHDAKFAKLPSDFVMALMFCSPVVSRDFSKQLLTCVHISTSLAEASDSFRLAQHTFSSDGKITHDFLIPGNACREIIKFNPSTYAVHGGWAHFKNATSAVISCRIFSEKYPNTANVLKMQETQDVEFPDEADDMIERASAFFKEDNDRDEQILLSFSKGKMEMSCQSVRGWFKENARVEYTGDPVVLAITPSFLKGILKDSKHAVIDPTKMLFAENNWKYLTLLRNQ